MKREQDLCMDIAGAQSRLRAKELEAEPLKSRLAEFKKELKDPAYKIVSGCDNKWVRQLKLKEKAKVEWQEKACNTKLEKVKGEIAEIRNEKTELKKKLASIRREKNGWVALSFCGCELTGAKNLDWKAKHPEAVATVRLDFSCFSIVPDESEPNGVQLNELQVQFTHGLKPEKNTVEPFYPMRLVECAAPDWYVKDVLYAWQLNGSDQT